MWLIHTRNVEIHSCVIWVIHTRNVECLPRWGVLWVTSHIHVSCYVWMSHVTYEWVISHMKESWHIWMSHVTCWMSHVTYELVMSRIKSRVRHECPALRRLYEGVISHMNESRNIWMSHVIYEWVFPRKNASRRFHIWRMHVAHVICE